MESLKNIASPLEPISSSHLSDPQPSPALRKMSKVKPNRFCINTQQRVKISVRYAAILVVFVILVYFSIHYLDISHKTIPLIARDRSHAYRVKILSDKLSDADLNMLPKESFSYLTIIDAGSSGCRAHVYRYGKLGSADGPLYVLPQHDSKKVKPGLSTFNKNPKDAGPSLTDLVQFMKEKVPEADWEVTPIWLKATAGLRMLSANESEAILESIREFLLNKSNSPFLFHSTWARIISGNEEGGFGWIAFNYLKKIIGPKKSTKVKSPPYAVIEMGGASAQVSQMAPSIKDAEAIPPEYRFSFTIEDDDYHLYTHSYLGYGAEQAREKYSKYSQQSPNDPCTIKGSAASKRILLDRSRHLEAANVSGSVSNNEKNLSLTDAVSVSLPAKTEAKGILKTCAKNMISLFSSVVNLSRRTQECNQPKPHTFNCVHQPRFVIESTNILAFENFFYMSSALGVKPIRTHKNYLKVTSASNSSSAVATIFPLETTASNIKEASEEFCSLHWNTVQASYPRDAQSKDVNTKMCFISGFSYSFLVDGLKIPENKIITIQKEVDGSEIEWALGAAYKEGATFLKRTNLRSNPR